jgi:pyruvate/2-oxoglutarate dehydrogenase complex dihydrolipoamide dehydrogenase (E3) component
MTATLCFRLWSLGDVTGVALFTHVANYRGRVVARKTLGRQRTASCDGILGALSAVPRVPE